MVFVVDKFPQEYTLKTWGICFSPAVGVDPEPFTPMSQNLGLEDYATQPSFFYIRLSQKWQKQTGA